MKSQPKSRISSMLTEAYHQLGVNHVRELETRTREALEYLRTDREHYIEVVDADTPEYHITTKHGIICKLIPLAREITRNQEKDHIREHTTVFSLMLSDSGNRFVYSHSSSKLYPNPSQNSFSYPVYRYAELEDIHPGLQIFPPQEIRPAATELNWEVYAMMLTAFAQLDRSKIINNIPHKTERAMLVYERTLPQELTIAGKTYLGKLVPLALEPSMQEVMREDHLYSYRSELCLLVTQEDPCYVLKTHHTYNYFHKEIIDDVPGNCTYVPAKEVQDTTYVFVNLSELTQDMYPLYY